MRGLDTNVLVRYITTDDPEQARLARSLIEEGKAPFFINVIALCELVWVLRSSPYRFGRTQVGLVLGSLFESSLFEIQEREVAERALDDYRSGRADFSDYLLGRINRAAGCEDTVTFDGKLGGMQGFALLTG